MAEPPDPGPLEPDEVERHREAERRGNPFLMYRDNHAALVVLSLQDEWQRVTIGRAMGADISLHWDREVSTVHAQLERVADDWVIVDDGLSRNGSFVNGEQVAARRRLEDADELRLGTTRIAFRAPFQLHDSTVVRPAPAPEA